MILLNKILGVNILKLHDKFYVKCYLIVWKSEMNNFELNLIFL